MIVLIIEGKWCKCRVFTALDELDRQKTPIILSTCRSRPLRINLIIHVIWLIDSVFVGVVLGSFDSLASVNAAFKRGGRK